VEIARAPLAGKIAEYESYEKDIAKGG